MQFRISFQTCAFGTLLYSLLCCICCRSYLHIVSLIEDALTVVSVRNAVCTKEAKECTFSPSINPASRLMVDNGEIPQTFIERQEHFIDKKRRQEARRHVASVSKQNRYIHTYMYVCMYMLMSLCLYLYKAAVVFTNRRIRSAHFVLQRVTPIEF